jgi:membrane-associated protease RseP (regulator of RpoE activity)
MVDIYLVVFIAFIVFIAAFFYVDRKNVKREGIAFLRRTTKGKAFLTWLGQRFPRIWWVYGTLAVVVGFYYSIYFTGLTFGLILDILLSDTTPQIGGIVLPSPTADAVSVPGVIGLPIINWVIIIFLLLLVHEGSHAIMAVREGVRIKSMGWGAFAFLPVAFMEPDEKELDKKKAIKQLRVYAAGSFGNIVIAILFTYLVFMTAPSFYQAGPGVSFAGYYMDGYPAQEANLTGTIIEINGFRIDTAQNLSDVLDQVGPGAAITITSLVPGPDGTIPETFNLVTREDPDGGEGGFIGITQLQPNIMLKEGVNPGLANFFYGKNPFILGFGFFGLLQWIAVINFAIGALNLLPAFPLDGGRMWKILFDRILPNRSMGIMKILTTFIWGMIIFMIGIAVVTGSTLF